MASVAFSPGCDPAAPRPWAALIFSTAISAWVGRRTPGARRGADAPWRPSRLAGRVAALVIDDGMLEGFVADVAFQAGVGVVVLAEEALALLLRRGRGAVFVKVAAVVAVAGVPWSCRSMPIRCS